jgi:hypothetical protein
MLTVKPYDKESDRVRYIATSFSFKNSPELRFKKNLLRPPFGSRVNRRDNEGIVPLELADVIAPLVTKESFLWNLEERNQ